MWGRIFACTIIFVSVASYPLLRKGEGAEIRLDFSVILAFRCINGIIIDRKKETRTLDALNNLS